MTGVLEKIWTAGKDGADKMVWRAVSKYSTDH